MPKTKRLPSPPLAGSILLKAAHSPLQPDVWKVYGKDGPKVWKTFRESPSLLRRTICRWIAAREARNLRLLEGMDGIPRLISMPEPWTIEMTWLNAEPLPEVKQSLPQAYFIRLDAMLSEMHSRGLNHGDLRRKNLLRDTETGEPRLLDFAQSLYGSTQSSLYFKIIVQRAFEIDRLKLLKLKKWYLGGAALTDEERRDLAAIPLHLRAGRFLRKRLYRPLKHWRTRKGKRLRNGSHD